MRQARREPREEPRTRDAGFTLVEIIATITVLSVMMAPMMMAVVATVRSSASNRNIAQIETVLQNAADRVNRAPKRCDYSVYVRAAAQSIGWRPDQATAVAVDFVPPANPTLPGTWVAPTNCNENALAPLLVQRVTIRVASPDGSVSRMIEVVKSDV